MGQMHLSTALEGMGEDVLAASRPSGHPAVPRQQPGAAGDLTDEKKSPGFPGRA